MAEAHFYHMIHTPLEQTLPQLLTRALAQGWRVAVRGRHLEQLKRLDERLWVDVDFLPHGIEGGPHDADQPVLLTIGEAGNDPVCLVSVDGAPVEPAEAEKMTRVMICFDGNDPQAVDTARGQWRLLTAGGVAAKYWSQETGRWALKAES